MNVEKVKACCLLKGTVLFVALSKLQINPHAALQIKNELFGQSFHEMNQRKQSVKGKDIIRWLQQCSCQGARVELYYWRWQEKAGTVFTSVLDGSVLLVLAVAQSKQSFGKLTDCVTADYITFLCWKNHHNLPAIVWLTYGILIYSITLKTCFMLNIQRQVLTAMELRRVKRFITLLNAKEGHGAFFKGSLPVSGSHCRLIELHFSLSNLIKSRSEWAPSFCISGTLTPCPNIWLDTSHGTGWGYLLCYIDVERDIFITASIVIVII